MKKSRRKKVVRKIAEAIGGSLHRLGAIHDAEQAVVKAAIEWRYSIESTEALRLMRAVDHLNSLRKENSDGK